MPTKRYLVQTPTKTGENSKRESYVKTKGENQGNSFSPTRETIFSSVPEILKSDECFRSRLRMMNGAVERSSAVGRQPVIFTSLFRIVLKVGLRSQRYICQSEV